MAFHLTRYHASHKDHRRSRTAYDFLGRLKAVLALAFIVSLMLIKPKWFEPDDE
jgi:preprotein translocase subunit SecG